MAIYHMSIKITSRGNGKSAVAAAAYRAGERITNEYDGVTHDYTRKSGIVHTAILLPDNAPPEYKDRAVLWNVVEKIEKAKNSQLAREIELALPVELTKEQNIFLVHEYVKRHFVNHGMCADIAIHNTGGGNPHAHVLLTMRPFNEDRTWGDKQKKVYHFDEQGSKIYDPIKRQYKCSKVQTTDWNEQTKAEEWRGAWADYVNGVLEHNGHAARIDHRSYARQGIDQIPTIHLGAAASQMEKRGIRTERGDINRDIEVSNQQLRQLKVRLSKLQTWLKEEMQSTAEPTLADIISNILNRQKQTGQPSRYGSIYNLKAAADMLNFLTSNKITDMAGLDKKLQDMIGERLKIGDELKPIDRRLKVLDEHIRQAGLYREFASINKLYKQQKPKQQADFYETHRRELTLYEAAERYIKAHLNGRDKIPLPTWKSERERLTVERGKLNQQYQNLKTETAKVERIRSNVYDIMSAERRREQPRRAQDIGR